jgi:hypothetical protein
MIRRSIALAAFCTLMALPGLAPAQSPPQPFMTGNQWLGLYESGEAGKEAAAAYVAGYVDGVQAAEATARRKRFCVPDDVTELELADVVAAYVSGRSVFRQMGAPFVIDGALTDRYRC